MLRRAAVYLPNFLDGFDRLVAFDAETTGKRTPDAEFIRKQPFAWRAPGIIIEVGFVEMLREGEGWRKGETWHSRVNPDGPIDPEAIKIHRIRPADLKNAPRFPTILPKVKDFVGDSPIVAHAYKNERDFLDYEFARAKVIPWGESAYPEERYICTQVLFAQLFPGSSKSLTSMCDRLVLDSSERDDRHGALLDAHMTADALILLEHQLKHGESGAPRSWTLT
jgi:DNA polymerase-3 subunit epsilon